MTIDRTRLAGDPAYLRIPGSADVNLAAASGSAPPAATSLPLGEGMQLELSAIDLLIEGSNLELLFDRGPKPILSLEIRQVDGALEFRSLQELMAASEDPWWVAESDGTVTRIFCKLPLSACLTQGEQVSLLVTPGLFSRLEARMEATLSLRPFDPGPKP